MFNLKDKNWNYADADTNGTGEDGQNTWIIRASGRIVATGTKDECTFFINLVKKWGNVNVAEQKMGGSEYCPTKYTQQGQKPFGDSLNISLSR